MFLRRRTISDKVIIFPFSNSVTLSIPAVSVIIPNFNGRSLLQQIIPPLLEALQDILSYEIIVVDDCSSDESVTFLRSYYPGITVVENETNRGFSASVNKGISAARHKYLLLLNSDVKLTRDYFAPLFRYFDRPDTFGVMGRMIGWEDDVIQDGGKYPFFHGAKIKTSGNYVPVDPMPGSWLYTMYLSGANAFVDREKISLIQGFDEIFSPFYVEDFELSLRAWRLGWKCYYEHAAVCRHRTSSTVRSEKNKKAVKIIYNRNKMCLHAIHLNGLTRLLWYVQLMSEACMRILTFQFGFVMSVREFLKKKNEVAASRSMFAELSKKLGSDLSVKQVAEIIISSLSKEKIKRF